MPPITMNTRNRPTWSPSTNSLGLNELSSAITSPQKPASPGSPSEAIATNANTPPSFGIVCSMPPPIFAISRVW